MKTPATKPTRDLYWSKDNEKNKKRLEQLYPSATREELEKAFPEKNLQAIRKSANTFGITRIPQDGWNDELDALIKKGFEESQDPKYDSRTKRTCKYHLLNAINKICAKKNLRPKKWNTILKHAHELGLNWGARENAAETANENGEKPKNPWEPDALAAFLAKKRTAKELEKHFGMPLKEIEKKLLVAADKYELNSYRNSSGQHIFYCREKTKSRGEVQARVWQAFRPAEENDLNEGGSLLIKFPDNLDWRQIRIFALAEAYVGSPLHEAKRFNGYLGLGKHEYHHLIINGSIFALPSTSEADALIDAKMTEWEKENDDSDEDDEGGAKKKPPRINKKDAKIQLLLELQNQVETKLRPIAHKILWAHQGCTEERIERLLGFDPLENVCGILGIPYFKRPVIAVIAWMRRTFSFYAIHGTTTAKKRGSMLNAICNLLDQFEMINFIIMSHQMSGMENVVPRRVRDRVNMRIVDKNQHLVITPSFRSYEGSVEERKGQPLPARGSCAMILFPDGNCGFSD